MMKIPDYVIHCDCAADMCGTILTTLSLERNRKQLRENTKEALDSLFEMVDNWYKIYHENLKVIVDPECCAYTKSKAMKEYWTRRKEAEIKFRTSKGAMCGLKK